jgi:hypothetical protein
MSRFDPDKFTFLPITASVREFEPGEDILKSAILAALETARAGRQEVAAVDPIGPNNMPRMLQLSGWITYSDEVNANARAFTKADLEEVVANGMFKAPFFGMIDYNHDFNLYGVWYETKFAYDEVAQQWGIWGEGVIFAWRYTELADKMLAMQARNGNIKLSMACLAGFYEPAQTPEGTDYLVARKPVFFTTSVLDVDPAFPNSRAYGSEDPESTKEARAAELLKASLDEAEVLMKNADKASEGTEVEGVVLDEAKTEEAAVKVETVDPDGPDPKKKGEKADIKITTEESPTSKVATPADEEMDPDGPDPKNKAAAPDSPNDKNGKTPKKSEMATEERVGELEAQLQTANVALAAAKTTIETAEVELTALRAFKNEIETAEAEKVMTARRAVRMAELPKAILAEMDKEENKVLLDEMMTYDEAKWEAAKKVFAIASVGRKSFADRSLEEGSLSTSDDATSGHAISRWRTR